MKRDKILNIKLELKKSVIGQNEAIDTVSRMILRKFFRSKFLNRLDEIIAFNPLEIDEIIKY